MRRSSRGLAAAILTMALVALLASAGPAFSADSKGHGTKLDLSDCTACHSCPAPTKAEPCLDPCPRHDLGTPLESGAGPDVVVLDQLEDLYVPVRFDHASHARMTNFSGGCTACHHYTPKGEEHPSCRSCHPVEIVHEDLAQPGLKGAYHRQCLGCHSEWDRDTQCELCHEKKAGGRLHGMATEPATHAHYAPVEMLNVILFPTAEGDTVPFHHQRHSELYEPDCATCHSEQSCVRCHTHGETLHPMGIPSETDLHDYCFRCHSSDESEACHPDDECAHCHGRAEDDLFDHDTTGWKLNGFHNQVDCRSCHGPWTVAAHPDRRCESCHARVWDALSFDHALTGVTLDETHVDADCADCHAAGIGTTPACDACHDDDRAWNPKTGFAGE